MTRMDDLKSKAFRVVLDMAWAEYAKVEEDLENHMGSLYVIDFPRKLALKRSTGLTTVPWEEYLNERRVWRANADALREEIDDRYRKVFELLKIE
jgi:hypothetical protein